MYGGNESWLSGKPDVVLKVLKVFVHVAVAHTATAINTSARSIAVLRDTDHVLLYGACIFVRGQDMVN